MYMIITMMYIYIYTIVVIAHVLLGSKNVCFASLAPARRLRWPSGAGNVLSWALHALLLRLTRPETSSLRRPAFFIC